LKMTTPSVFAQFFLLLATKLVCCNSDSLNLNSENPRTKKIEAVISVADGLTDAQARAIESKLDDILSQVPNIERNPTNHSERVLANEPPAHQFSIAEQVSAFTNYPLDNSAVVLTSSNFTTNNPLDNLKDFSNWNATDIHDFVITHENAIEDNEPSDIDQLAVESEQSEAHAVLVNATMPTFTSKDKIKETEVNHSFDDLNSDLNAPAAIHELDKEDNPSLTGFSHEYRDVLKQVEHENGTDTNEPSTTNGLIDDDIRNSSKVHRHDGEQDEFNNHFDLHTSDDHQKIPHDLTNEPSDHVATTESAHKTEMYDEDLYEVVTANIDLHSEAIINNVINNQEENGGRNTTAHVLKSGEHESNDVEVVENDEKYTHFLDNLQSKYNDSDSNRDHAPVLFEDSFTSLVQNKIESIKESDASEESHPHGETVRNSPRQHNHPLISLMKIEPHAMKLLVKPRKFEPNTMVRLMYERVPRNKPALHQHLDDPVIEYIHIYRVDQEHYLTNLPMGKYIVCGDAQVDGKVFQSNCFETSIDRLDNNTLQGGVIAIIAIALLIVFCVIVYAIYHRMVISKEKDVERRLQEKVAKLASKENASFEKDAITYPDLNEPFEERCIM